MSPGAWTWLETAKLLITACVPIVILFLGLWVRRFSERLERRVRHSQIETDWRLSVFKEFAPKLNALYCCYNYVGGWREMSPRDIVGLKRECDRIVFTSRFLWSDTFMAAYARLIGAAFVEYRGPGQELILRANRDRYRENEIWRDSWQNCFVDAADRTERKDFNAAYDAVLDLAVRDLGIFQSAERQRQDQQN